MNWPNSAVVTCELFLDLELAMHDKTRPTPHTILNLNEIVELVVLKEKLLMPSVDLLIVINALNWDKLRNGRVDEINWQKELTQWGKGELKHPVFMSLLDDEGILVHSAGSDDGQYRQLQDTLLRRLQDKKWQIKSAAMMGDQHKREAFDLKYIRGFNDAFHLISPNPLYWKFQVLTAPHTAAYHKKRFGSDLTWAHGYYQAVKIYATFARRRKLGLSDTILMHPFVALNSQPSESFVDVFYKRLKDTRSRLLQELSELQQPWRHSVPPLTSILLQRCRTRDDLPMELIKLRDEFKCLRQPLTEFQKEFEEAPTIREKLELKNDFQNSLDLFTRKAKMGRKRIVKVLIDFALDEADSVVRKDLTGPVSLLMRKVADYVYSRRLRPWVNSFLDLHNRSLEIGEEAEHYERILGGVSWAHLSEFELFARNSRRLLDLCQRQHPR